MKLWIWGNALLATGLLWLACSRALASLYPVSWGGPNIGGGALNLVAYAAIGIGIALAVAELVTARRERLQPRSAEPDDSSRTSWWLPAALTVAAAVICGVVLIAPPGPGGTGRIGAVGVAVDVDGPVLVLVVCERERSIDTVTLVGPNRGSEPNEKLVTLSAPGGDLEPITLLPLNNLPPGWEGGPVSLPFQQAPKDLIIASGRGDQTYLAQVVFTAADLNALTPSEVRLSDSGTVKLGDVSSVVCTEGLFE